nr:hypothetical protein BdHM001_36420 [Bdellovibrio sp. HM001]
MRNKKQSKEELIKEAFLSLYQRLKRIPEGQLFYSESGFTREEVRHSFVSYTNLVNSALSDDEGFNETKTVKTLNSEQKLVIQRYIELVDEVGRIPSSYAFQLHLKADPETKELKDILFPDLFGSYTELISRAQKRSPKTFENIMTPLDVGPAAFKKHFEEVRKKKAIITTTAVPGAPVWKSFYKALKHLANDLDAKIVILKTSGDPLTIDPFLKNEFILTQDLYVNSNLSFWDVEAPATTKNIAKSFRKYTSVESSLVLASTKQIFLPAPSMGSLPRAVFTPGALTLPSYKKNSSGVQARNDHFMGAHVFKIKNDKVFFPYNMQALPDGSVVHMGTLYRPNGTKRRLTRSEIVRVDGDDHAMIHSKTVEKALARLQKQIPAHIKVSHDTWDQHISNHHNEGKYILKAKMAERGLDRIEVERRVTSEFLERKSKDYDQVVVVVANHNEALARFLDEARYIKESQNWLLGSILSLAQFHNIDPVEFATKHYDGFKGAIEKYFDQINKGSQIPTLALTEKAKLNKVRFMRVGETFEFGGFSLSYHGDEGAGGSSGTPEAMGFIHSGSVASYDAGVVTGHTHSSMIYNRTINVGTSTCLPHEEDAPGYVKGSPNAWFNSTANIYAPKEFKGVGVGELLLIMDGQYE